MIRCKHYSSFFYILALFLPSLAFAINPNGPGNVEHATPKPTPTMRPTLHLTTIKATGSCTITHFRCGYTANGQRDPFSTCNDAANAIKADLYAEPELRFPVDYPGFSNLTLIGFNITNLRPVYSASCGDDSLLHGSEVSDLNKCVQLQNDCKNKGKTFYVSNIAYGNFTWTFRGDITVIQKMCNQANGIFK